MNLVGGGFIGELAALIVVGVYAIGDPDEWGKQPLGMLRRVLVVLHALIALAGIDLVLWNSPIKWSWLLTIRTGINLSLFPMLALALFKSFPRRAGRMFQLLLAPLLWGGALILTRHLLEGTDLSAAVVSTSLLEEISASALIVFGAVGLGLGMLVLERIGDPASPWWRRFAQDDLGMIVFWGALLAACWGQLLHAVVVFSPTLFAGPLLFKLIYYGELVASIVQMGLAMRRTIPQGS